jgi:hypothetical protein
MSKRAWAITSVTVGIIGTVWMLLFCGLVWVGNHCGGNFGITGFLMLIATLVIGPLDYLTDGK